MTPPTTPQHSASVRGPSQVLLTWTESTDDLSWSVGYRFFANGAPVTEHVNSWGPHTVVLRHLAPATSYTLTVQAQRLVKVLLRRYDASPGARSDVGCDLRPGSGTAVAPTPIASLLLERARHGLTTRKT